MPTKIDLTKLIPGLMRMRTGPTQAEIDAGAAAARAHVRREEKARQRWNREGRRTWGTGTFAYSPKEGLRWEPGEDKPPQNVEDALTGAGFWKQPDGSWRMPRTRRKRMGELDRFKVERFEHYFGFDFRVLAAGD